jgi:cardiolipin synthase
LRSLLLNYEVTIVIHSPAEVQMVEDWIKETAESSTEGFEEAGFFRGMAEDVARLLSPLL